MTRIILVRHGHVDGINPERFRGRAKLALSELGRRQAQATASRVFRGWKPAAVYTSPMGRCIETGDAIGRPLALEVQAVDELNDIDYGSWQGMTPEEASRRWPEEVDAWFRTPHLAVIPGGETLAAVLSRSTAALREILHRHPKDTIVLVGHESINRILLLHTMELPLSRYWHFKQAPCAINELEFDGRSFVIWSINETCHLAGLEP